MQTRTLAILIFGILLVACGKEASSVTASPENSAESTPEQEQQTIVAERVFVNSRIYTVDNDQPWAEAIAVKDGKILTVGTRADVEAVTGDGTEVVDLGGKFVMPGLIDTHTHPFVDGLKQLGDLEFNFDSVEPSLEEMQRQITAYAEANPDRDWIYGGMWPKGVFPGENPMRQDLDAAIADRPTCLMDQGGHAYWCNTLALEISGMMIPGFEAPPFAIIERDAEGTPTGI